MSDKKEEQKASFWLTLPGCITALGGFVTAVVGSYVALVVAGVIPAPFAPTPTSPPPMIATLPNPEVTKPPSASADDSVSFVPTILPTSTFPPPPVMPPTVTQVPQSVCERYATIPLQLYWSEERQDNISVARVESINGATSAGYRFVATEGHVFQNPQDGTIPLVLYYEGYTSFDNFTVATSEGIAQAIAAGYWRVSDSVEGYVLRTQLPGTIPLNLYYHAQRGDNFTTASQSGQNDAQAWNYQFIRTEGYVCP